jgi:pimeloyl-ACP methyl ester carboxylesterase
VTRTDDSSAKRATSRDGTEIAYWTSGSGPPLVLVHGAPADHTRWQPLLPYLEPHATVHAMDRRGRGASGDGPEYRLTREFEDVVAVVDAVAAASGRAVDVYGHSFGGLCAFGAATLTLSIRRLALYEGWPLVNPEAQALPPALGERLDALLAEGNHEAVVETVFRELLMMSDEELAALRAQPGWPARVAAAQRIAREIQAISEAAFDPEQTAKITVPTLMLTGEDSPDPAAADIGSVSGALPDAHIVVLEGQQHVADVLAPEVFVAHLVAFLRDER